MVELQETGTGSFRLYNNNEMSESVFYVKLIHYRKIKDALLHCKRCPFAM